MMIKSWNRFTSNKYLVSFSLLASGSIIAQILSILVSPITTRLFTPEQFGYYTIIATAVALFGPIICLKYDMAIIIAKNNRETFSVIKLCLFISITLSILISVCYGLIFLRSSFNGLELLGYIFVIMLLLSLYGFNNILLSHNNKNALYKLISSVTVIKSFVNNLLLVISGLFNAGIIGIIGSQIISSFAGLGRQSRDLRKEYQKIKEIEFSEMRRVFFKYKKQPMYNASAALVTTSIYSSINLFIKSVYSVEQLGLYSLSYRILGIPFSVISANIARVYFDSAARELISDGKYSKSFNKTIIILLVTIIPIITIMAIISPWIFSFVFSQEWFTAGVYVRLLAPMFAIRLITESLTTGFIVSSKQHIELLFQGILFGGEIIVYIISFLMKIDIEIFLILISILYLIVYGSMIVVMYKLSKGKK